jgi:hypothetical protein
MQNASTVSGAGVEGEGAGAVVGLKRPPREGAADRVGGVHRCGTVAAMAKTEDMPEFVKQNAAKIDGAGVAAAIGGKCVFCSVEVDVPLACEPIGANPQDGLCEGPGGETRGPPSGVDDNARKAIAVVVGPRGRCDLEANGRPFAPRAARHLGD